MRIKLTKPSGVKAVVKRIECKGHKRSVIVMSPEQRTKDSPGVLWIHGGGYISGLKEMVYVKGC